MSARTNRRCKARARKRLVQWRARKLDRFRDRALRVYRNELVKTIELSLFGDAAPSPFDGACPSERGAVADTFGLDQLRECLTGLDSEPPAKLVPVRTYGATAVFFEPFSIPLVIP